MKAHTNRYGITVIKGDVAQAPTLESRVRDVLASYGVSTRGTGNLHSRACDLVRTYPQLSAAQAVDVVIARVDA